MPTICPYALLASLLLCSAFGQTCPTLIWSDEFDGSTLDLSNWTPQIGDGCDIDLCGWGNWEEQYYRAENAVVSDGTLKIIAREENFGTRRYTSARIRSLNKVDIDMTRSYIRIEARIKVAKTQSLWSAFWMMPSSEVLWPTGGEIDIMEVIGREEFFQQGYIHYGELWNDKSILGGPIRLPEPVADDFHVFAIEKTPGKITWFIDGYEFQSYTESDIQPKYSWPFEQDFHILLNVAVGGLWPGYPDDTSIFPATMEVDYVRVSDMSTASVGSITGPSRVHENQSAEYCIMGNNSSVTSIAWTVPNGATESQGTSSNCIQVTFGTEAGFVKAEVNSYCGSSEYRAPVAVQHFYGRQFSFGTGVFPIGPSTGTQTVTRVHGTPAIEYTRDGSQQYDNIVVVGSAIRDAGAYVQGDYKFFIDIMCETCAPCTRVMVQLESSGLASADNYPIGRHSRYEGYIEKTNNFQRLELSFKDQPDKGVTDMNVDQIVLLFDGGNIRSDTYFFRNFDSSRKGCQSNCEALTTNMCRVAANSEAGQCTDGLNNDGLTFTGNAVSDCEDPNCYKLDPACMFGDEAIATSAPTRSPISSTASPISPTNSPTVSPTPALTVNNNPKCSAHPRCSNLSGNCCPTTPGGQKLYCCENFGIDAPPPPAPPSGNELPECSAHNKCSHLAGNCCPTAQGVKLDCCGSFDTSYSLLENGPSRVEASVFGSDVARAQGDAWVILTSFVVALAFVIE